tara:strand:- start:39 stop:617 length:579 start_codon:yes stop_codon:yes gene_type:complete
MKKIILQILFIFSIFPAFSEIKIKPISEGNIDANIEIIVFESLTCIHCANFHEEIYPKLKKNYIDKGLAKIEFRSFPLDLAALNASKISHCRNDGKSEILHFLFKNQKEWAKGNTVEEFNKNLKEVVNSQKFGIDFDKCLNNKEIEDFVLEDRINGVKKFKVNATPTIIINNKKFDKTLNYENLEEFIVNLI